MNILKRQSKGHEKKNPFCGSPAPESSTQSESSECAWRQNKRSIDQTHLYVSFLLPIPLVRANSVPGVWRMKTEKRGEKKESTHLSKGSGKLSLRHLPGPAPLPPPRGRLAVLAEVCLEEEGQRWSCASVPGPRAPAAAPPGAGAAGPAGSGASRSGNGRKESGLNTGFGGFCRNKALQATLRDRSILFFLILQIIIFKGSLIFLASSLG